MNKQSIVFAHYKGDKLLGYRMDTFGTLGLEWGKVYTYSKEQVEVVLGNIAYSMNAKENLGSLLGIKEVEASLDKTQKDMIDSRAFEVRVLAFPVSCYEQELNLETGKYEEVYVGMTDRAAMDAWVASPEDHEVIETHYFSFEGKLNLQ